MVEKNLAPVGSRVWNVGALCRAIADALDARFNPVTVAGEIAGFTRAASGHCYFTLKDDSGQVRCAMFRRAAALLDFPVRDGDRVEVQGRVGVYEPRLINTSFSRCGLRNTVIMADKLMTTGFTYATRAGISIYLDDMLVPPQKNELINAAGKEVREIDVQYTSGLVTQGERYNKVVDIWG